MEKFGELLGWVTAICYFIAISDFFVKRIYRISIVKLKNNNALRSIYQILMRLIVGYHRYFGMAAGAFALVHMGLQLVNEDLSLSGVSAAGSMVLTAILGIIMTFAHKKKLARFHRPIGLLVLAIVLFHILIEG